jgi:hypothetical protein
VFLAAQPGGPLGILFALVEALEEEEERQLLDGVERVGEPAGPELVPEGIDLRAQGGVGEHGAKLPRRELLIKGRGFARSPARRKPAWGTRVCAKLAGAMQGTRRRNAFAGCPWSRKAAHINEIH